MNVDRGLCVIESKPGLVRLVGLLALAHKFQGMLDRGEVKSMAELAAVPRG